MESWGGALRYVVRVSALHYVVRVRRYGSCLRPVTAGDELRLSSSETRA